MSQFTMTINGAAVGSDQQLSVLDPATGRPFAECPDCSEAQLDQAVRAAKAALPTWQTHRMSMYWRPRALPWPPHHHRRLQDRPVSQPLWLKVRARAQVSHPLTSPPKATWTGVCSQIAR